MGIEDAFGGTFFSQYAEAMKKSRVKRLTLDPTTRNEIIGMAKRNLKGDAPQMNFLKNGIVYHVMLMETMAELRARQLQFGISVSLRWKGNWVSAVFEAADLEKIAPNTAYLLVGYMRTKTGADGRIFYNYNVHGVITMEEIAKFTENDAADANLTKEVQGENQGDNETSEGE